MSGYTEHIQRCGVEGGDVHVMLCKVDFGM